MGVVSCIKELGFRNCLSLYIRSLWRRKTLIIVFLPLILFLVWAILETTGQINWVNTTLPQEVPSFAQIAGAIATVILTFGLVVLYERQTLIQEQQYKPHLTGEIDALEITSSQFLIRNSGQGYAYQVSAEWEVAGETRTWEIPSLGPGDKFGFPVIVDENGQWVLSTEKIREILEENDSSTEIDYVIRCQDQFQREITFPGSVDFEIIFKRSESNEIWKKDPLERIQSDLGDMRRDIKKMSREVKKMRQNSEWMHRSRKNKMIIEFVNEYGPLSKYEISRLSGISEESLEYRLSELQTVNAIEYSEKSEIAKPSRKGAKDRTLDEF